MQKAHVGLRSPRQSLQRVLCATRKINQVYSLFSRGYYHPDDSATSPKSGRPMGRRGEELTVQIPRGLLPSSPPPPPPCSSPTCLPNLLAPLLWVLSLPQPEATLKHLVAIELLLRELSHLLQVRDPTWFLSPIATPSLSPRDVSAKPSTSCQEEIPGEKV